MARNPEHEDYPAWICADCGEMYGHWPAGHLATFHPDKCGWCGELKAVTEPRDYSYPDFPPRKKGVHV